jgi:hypothetical protein
MNKLPATQMTERDVHYIDESFHIDCISSLLKFHENQINEIDQIFKNYFLTLLT